MKTLIMLFAVLFVTATGFAQVQTTVTKAETAAKRQGAKAKKYKYTCSMHPSVKRMHPGKCPKCKMKLVAIRKGRQAPVPLI